ncbi:hypothetical protein B0G62_102162 [Paraburkholderia eburnea]|uniref:Uncharacterized protein n=1 Tax=Paraburkholderia eburnea TaxID=1189126 RepID=A0A2S4MIH0_9BURK|nr:hypothetical protein [Paraburkholderia eburnea]POR54554.1 hypothetical protein B0G62_102162 [Paraburkholderia eburnea]PRZ19769.1 hypothetical protein BX588_114162 [Paraburkholderia eburnea]
MDEIEKPRRARAPEWTPAENALLRKVWKRSAPLKTVTHLFPSRSENAIVMHGIRLGLPDRRRKMPGKRTAETIWPRIEAALRVRPASLDELAALARCSNGTVRRFIKAKRTEVHIAKYLRAIGTRNVTALWAWGAGEDAPRPPRMTEAEQRARYKRKLERERPEELDRQRARARVRAARRDGRLVRRDPMVVALFGNGGVAA